MKTLVIGANGSTGRQIVRLLKDHPDHEPVALIRSALQRETFEREGIATSVGDLLQPIDDAVRGMDAVLFAAGSGSRTGKDMTVLIDQLGAIRSMVAALQAGAMRFVMLSGLGVDRDATSGPIPHWRRAKGRADDFLRTMPAAFDGAGLDYTIVCPGRLTDARDDDAIRVVDPSENGETSRRNVARTMVACLDLPNTVGETIGVIDGDTRVSDALAGL